MSAQEIRSKVVNEIRSRLAARGLHVAESGQRLRDEDLINKIDEDAGTWKDGGSDPQRWLVRIVPANGGDDFEIKPLAENGYRLGITSAKTQRGPTSAIIVRVGAFVLNQHSFFLAQEFIWLLWFILEKPLPESLGNSARINRFSLTDKTLTFQEETVKFIECGLVGTANPNAIVQTSSFKRQLTFGEVTNRLQKFIEAGSPKPVPNDEEGM